MGAKKQQELDHELLAVAWNLLSEAPRNMRAVMRARDRLLERSGGDFPLFVRHRAAKVTESEVADALELLSQRKEILRSDTEEHGVTFAKKPQ